MRNLPSGEMVGVLAPDKSSWGFWCLIDEGPSTGMEAEVLLSENEDPSDGDGSWGFAV